MNHIRAVLFDKDGTLFDFQRTWGAWARGVIADLAAGDAVRAQALAEAMAYDPGPGRFRPESLVIAGTSLEVAELLAPHVPPVHIDALVARLQAAAQGVEPVESVPLGPLLARLRAAGLRLGVATNDNEATARRHVAPYLGQFEAVFGYDSGHGGKPEPGMLLAFAARCGLEPAQVLMVGDSRHDLIAGRAAGMATLAVLTGVAQEPDLADLADAVRPDIGHLPALLAL